MTKPSTQTTQSFIDGLDGILAKGKKPRLAQKIALDKIVFDPDQPRREFDQAELDELAASIRANGVVTPIAVRPAADDGTHMLVYGERRVRAAKIAGLSEVVSTIIDPSTTNIRTVQLIENMQRTDLNSEEIATAIEVLVQEGTKATEVARLLGLPPARITEFRAILAMPPKLRALSATTGARTLYQLFGLWKKDGQSVERLIETQGANGITRAHVEALSERLKLEATEPKPQTITPVSAIPAEEGDAVEAVQRRRGAPQSLSGRVASGDDTQTPASISARDQTNTVAPSWIVKHGDAFGRLVTDRPGPDSKTAIVSFDNGQDVRPVALSELTLFEIVGG